MNENGTHRQSFQTNKSCEMKSDVSDDDQEEEQDDNDDDETNKIELPVDVWKLLNTTGLLLGQWPSGI
jgi:hypothetical protein